MFQVVLLLHGCILNLLVLTGFTLAFGPKRVCSFGDQCLQKSCVWLLRGCHIGTDRHSSANTNCKHWIVYIWKSECNFDRNCLRICQCSNSILLRLQRISWWRADSLYVMKLVNLDGLFAPNQDKRTKTSIMTDSSFYPKFSPTSCAVRYSGLSAGHLSLVGTCMSQCWWDSRQCLPSLSEEFHGCHGNERLFLKRTEVLQGPVFANAGWKLPQMAVLRFTFANKFSDIVAVWGGFWSRVSFYINVSSNLWKAVKMCCLICKKNLWNRVNSKYVPI